MKADEHEEVDQEKRMASTDQGEHEKRHADRVTSTREIAKTLESASASQTDDRSTNALFPENESRNFQKRWTDIQTAFVDEPRRAVEQADELVAEVIKRLADSFAQERSKLEGQWGRGDKVSTEDLRVILQRYRAFFDRLLNI
jgi:hypothetical protein